MFNKNIKCYADLHVDSMDVLMDRGRLLKAYKYIRLNKFIMCCNEAYGVHLMIFGINDEDGRLIEYLYDLNLNCIGYGNSSFQNFIGFGNYKFIILSDDHVKCLRILTPEVRYGM